MKSFGVRLGAGAVTILFGAYAAAIAQKDRQEDSDSWTAEASVLGEPAAPIGETGEMGGPSWLGEPPTDLGGEQSKSGAAPPDAIFQAADTVQLAQHTEPVGDAGPPSTPSFDGTLPASLGAETEPQAAAETPQADWMLPDSAATANAGGDAESPAMTMSFPGSDSGPSVPDADFDPSAADAPSGLNVADIPAMEFYPAEKMEAGPSRAAPSNAALDAAGDAPDIGLDGSAVPAIVAGGAALGMAVADSGTPTNLLRGAPESENALRGDTTQTPDATSALDYGADASTNSDVFAGSPEMGSPAMGSSVPSDAISSDTGPSAYGAVAEPLAGEAANGAGLAQDAASFGASAQQFDQPASMPGVSTAGLGTPQAGPAAASEGFAPQAQANTSDRMASLSREGQPAMNSVPNGYQPAAMAQPNTAMAIDQSMTLDSPGERRLEGAQSPSVIIQKRAPAEVKVGKPASFVVHVQNVGAVEALNVEVHDRVPAGMRLVDASPMPVQQGNLLMWEIGSMPAGDERTITMQLVPEQEGELGSVARVSFEAAASVRTIATRPELKIVQRVPDQGVLIGQQLEIELEVSNPGSGAATGVVLQENVPEGLDHPQGRELDNLLGTLEPGEVRTQVLRLRAVKPGIIQNTIRLVGDDGLTAEHSVTVQVVAPELQIELDGPSKRFLERQATYELKLANNGTADATNVEISVQLDRGFTFVSTDKQGQYDPARHAVFWSVASVPAGASGSVPLTLLPVEAGDQAIKFDARADLGVFTTGERQMSVEGFVDLSFAISNPGGPIEVGAETNYEIHVTNSGSQADTNVRVQLQLPEGLELVSADGDAGHDGQGMVAFQPKGQLAPGEDLKLSLRVRGVAAGTHIVRAVVLSDHSTVPLTKEESTRVYADR